MLRVEHLDQRRQVVLVSATAMQENERAVDLSGRPPDEVDESVRGHRTTILTSSAAMSEAADPARHAAAATALERVEPGMTIGLGSGRAVWQLIELIGEHWPQGPPLRAVFASDRTAELGRSAGIEAVELDGALRLHLALDGADEVGPDLGLIKGGGAALLREKLVVAAAERFVVMAEVRKRVERLGQAFPLPVEVVRFAWQDTRRRLLALLPSAELRTDDGGAPVVTDEGHHLLDCALPTDRDPGELGALIKATVGVVEHGLFIGMADEALLGRDDGGVDVIRASEP
jgi:ribose 5-phosphate isomerase A